MGTQKKLIAGAYVINLLELPAITEKNIAKVHQFYEKLLFTVESLETLLRKTRICPRRNLLCYCEKVKVSSKRIGDARGR